jgi:hypothetical protein
MKICQVRGELFHEDGQADMTKLMVAFLNIASAHKKWHSMVDVSDKL